MRSLPAWLTCALLVTVPTAWAGDLVLVVADPDGAGARLSSPVAVEIDLASVLGLRHAFDQDRHEAVSENP